MLELAEGADTDEDETILADEGSHIPASDGEESENREGSVDPLDTLAEEAEVSEPTEKKRKLSVAGKS